MMLHSKATIVDRWKGGFVDMVNITIISQSQLLKSEKLDFPNYKDISSTGSILACLPNSTSFMKVSSFCLSLPAWDSAALQSGLVTHEGDDTSLQHSLYKLDGGHLTSFLAAAAQSNKKYNSLEWQPFPCRSTGHCLTQGLTTTAAWIHGTCFFHCSQ